MLPINSIEIYSGGILIEVATVGVAGCKSIEICENGNILVITSSKMIEYGGMQYILVRDINTKNEKDEGLPF